MAKLLWNVAGDRVYETGISKTVLYVDGHAPTKWTGLQSVSNNPSSGEIESRYFDGIKYSNTIAKQELKLTIKAINIPKSFNDCIGIRKVEHEGLLVTNQQLSNFNLTFVTGIGNDTEGLNKGYKIHLIFNATSLYSDKTYDTISESTSVNPISIDISSSYPLVNGIATSPYRVIDTRKYSSTIISNLEDILYGTDTTLPRFPTAEELQTILGV